MCAHAVVLRAPRSIIRSLRLFVVTVALNNPRGTRSSGAKLHSLKGNPLYREGSCDASKEVWAYLSDIQLLQEPMHLNLSFLYDRIPRS